MFWSLTNFNLKTQTNNAFINRQNISILLKQIISRDAQAICESSKLLFVLGCIFYFVCIVDDF